jgi:hypothetical protein
MAEKKTVWDDPVEAEKWKKAKKSNEMQLYWLNRERKKRGMPQIYVDWDDFESANKMMPIIMQERLNMLRAGGDNEMPMDQRHMTMGGVPMMQQMDPGGQSIPGLTPQSEQAMFGDQPMPPQADPQMYEEAALALENYGFQPKPHLIETYVQLKDKVEPGELFKLIQNLANAKARQPVDSSKLAQ